MYAQPYEWGRGKGCAFLGFTAGVSENSEDGACTPSATDDHFCVAPDDQGASFSRATQGSGYCV